MRNIVVILLIFLCEDFIFAQDIHWSQVNENAMYQNPANTGQFNGDFRVSLSSKDQWRNVTKPYQTQSLTFDVINKYDRNLGYGGLLIHDMTGDGVFRTLELRLTPAYTFFNNKTKKSHFRIGLDIGLKYNQLNFSNFMFDNQFDGFMYLNSLPSNEKFTTQHKLSCSIGFGMLYTKKISEKIAVFTGISLFNINQPNQGFYNENIPRTRRLHYYVQSNISLNNKTKLIPSFNFQFQGTYNELIIGAKFEYYSSKILPKYELISGIYGRSKDAIFTQMGIKIGKIITCINYDINLSKLAKASNGRGGFEFNVQYIWNRIQEKNIMHKKCLDYL